MDRVIKSIEKAWLKPYIDLKRKLGKKKRRIDFMNFFFKLIINAGFGKTIENIRKHRDIKFVTAERRRDYLVSETNYHTTKF